MIITVMGEVNHGKTSLIESLLGKSLLKSRAELKDLRTRNLQIEDFKIKDKTYYILDCPGHSSYLNNSILPLPYSDLIILVFSSVQSTLPEKMMNLLSYCKYHNKKLLLVLTKTDICSRELFLKRASKIISLLRLVGIEDIESIIFSTKKESLKRKLLEKIQKLCLTITPSDKKETLVIRSFNKTQPGASISKYHSGILGCLSTTNFKVGEYFLNKEQETIKFKVKNIKNPSQNSTGFITCDTDLAGCYCSSDRLKGAIISQQPLLRNKQVTLIMDKILTTPPKGGFSQTYIVTGFSIYKLDLPEKIKGKLEVTIPLRSGTTFLLLSKTDGIWGLISFGRIQD